MVLVDAEGLPLGIDIAAANRNEAILIEPLLDKQILPTRRVSRLIYDKAADSDGLRRRLLAERRIDLITPHKRSRKRPALQDRRKLRRYTKRWKVERSIAWLHNFRRLVVRWEYHAHLFQGFLQLACLFTILRRF